MRHMIWILFILCLPIVACSQNNTNQQQEDAMALFGKKAPQAGDENIPEGNHVRIDLASGSIMIELYPDVAPNTVANFKALIGQGFYDGLSFHRVIAGFVAQGGDPKGDGTGGPGYQVKAEFNDKHHLRGTLSMARSANPDSAGSQFYICYDALPHLDGQYTVFGQVIEGMDIVDQIKVGTIMEKLTVLP